MNALFDEQLKYFAEGQIYPCLRNNETVTWSRYQTNRRGKQKALFHFLFLIFPTSRSTILSPAVETRFFLEYSQNASLSFVRPIVRV